jgi:hypothetical protein
MKDLQGEGNTVPSALQQELPDLENVKNFHHFFG